MWFLDKSKFEIDFIQSWWFVYFLRPLDKQFVLNIYYSSITCFGSASLITCFTRLNNLGRFHYLTAVRKGKKSPNPNSHRTQLSSLNFLKKCTPSGVDPSPLSPWSPPCWYILLWLLIPLASDAGSLSYPLTSWEGRAAEFPPASWFVDVLPLEQGASIPRARKPGRANCFRFRLAAAAPHSLILLHPSLASLWCWFLV